MLHAMFCAGTGGDAGTASRPCCSSVSRLSTLASVARSLVDQGHLAKRQVVQSSAVVQAALVRLQPARGSEVAFTDPRTVTPTAPSPHATARSQSSRTNPCAAIAHWRPPCGGIAVPRVVLLPSLGHSGQSGPRTAPSGWQRGQKAFLSAAGRRWAVSRTYQARGGRRRR